MPPGFQDTVVTSSVSGPSVLAFAPGGRLFVGEKGTGQIRIIQGSTLLATPFLDLDDIVEPPAFFDTFFERGLLGIAFDPSFGTNGFVYVYYTICKVPGGGGSCASAKNRVSRFVASGNTAIPGETVILDDIGSDAGNHNAGWIDFGADGKLYVAVGDGGATNTKAQDLGTLNGKLLRINADGSVPADNPFVGLPGVREEIWASGFRNPWRCRFQPLSDRLFCGDVGQNTWEEVDIVEAGENYGWPVTEGPFNQNNFAYSHPIDWYNHNGGSASITGGDFGARTNFPGDYQQSYFYADFVLGRIWRAILDGSGSLVEDVQDFATALGGNSVTDLVAGPDGNLYYANYGANQVRRISATASPVAVAAATPSAGNPPLDVQFSSAGSTVPAGSPTFLWNFDDASTSTQANPLHSFAADGAYTVTLTVNDADATTPAGVDTVVVTVGQPPVVTISAPTEGQQFEAGDTVTLTGSADDPAATLEWEIIFHHNTHIHPFLDGLAGGSQSFVWATSGEPAPDVGYEVILRATAASGLVGEARRMILPVLGEFTLASSPSGRVVTLDGQPRTTPVTIDGVVGFVRTIGVSSTGGFLGWSDGGAATHTIATPAVPTTFTASFTDPCGAPTVIPAAGGTVTGSTAGGSGFTGSCGGGSAPERIFSWTPTSSGTATIETCSTTATTYDTVLYLRTGSCGGTQLACNDDTTGCGTTTDVSNPHRGSRITTNVTSGTMYFIVVDGFQANAGAFALTVVPPGANTTTTSSTSSSSTTPPTTTSTSTTSSTTSSTVLATTTSSTTSSTSSTAVTTTSSTTSTTGTAPTTSTTSTSSTTSSTSSTAPPTTTSSTSSSTTSTAPSTTTSSTRISTTSTSTSSTITFMTTTSTVTTTTSSSSSRPRATSTTTSTVPPPRCDPSDPSACDDGDACTDDRCEPAVGCVSVATTDVTCVATNLRTIVEAVPSCGGRCARAMARDLKKVERAGTVGPRRCRQRLTQAARAARAIAKRGARRGGGEALAAETERLLAELRATAAVSCPGAKLP